MSEPWTEDYNVNDLGLTTGSIVGINSQKVRRKKHPLGFAPPAVPPRKPRGGRRPGSWPDVPHFDITEEP